MRRFLRYGFLVLVFALPWACSTAEPAVTGISPTFGLTRGGDMVFIRGTNLEEMGTLTVYFGNKRAQKTGVTRAGEHWAIAPPNATEGLFDVRIVGADGDAYLLPLGFEYVKHADMAECVNISHQINGTMVPKRQEK